MEVWAKVTPFTVLVGGTSCPAWLADEIHGQHPPTPFFRWDIRTRLLMRLREAHATMRAPMTADLGSVPGGMLPEQRWYYESAARKYCDTFAHEPGQDRPHGCDKATTFQRRHLNVSGAVDLLLDLPDGTAELRQFELWQGALSADPYESWEIALAVLRLHLANPELRALSIRHVDLLSGEMDSYRLDVHEHARPIAHRLDEEVAELRSRASAPVETPGRSCGRCRIALSCSAWHDRPRAQAIAADPGRTDYVGPVVHLSPTSLTRWLQCPRSYRAAHLLDLPSGTLGPRSDQGITVHKCLAQLHQDGPCPADPTQRIEAAADAEILDDTLLGFLRRHARRCPTNARSIGHELDLAQLHTWGSVPIMVTARIDAVWEQNGVLLCRDYKTGPPRFDRVADDPAARIQAWLLARLAAQRNLQLELRYEHLAVGVDEDPDPYTPYDEDISLIGQWIGQVGADIAASDFAGVSEAVTCRRCPYRRACPDVVLEDDEDDGDTVVLRAV